MKFLVFGSNNERIVSIAREAFSGHSFDCIEEIFDIDKQKIAGTYKIRINHKYNLEDYHGIILNDTSTIYNYLWSESASHTSWFPSPFDLRNASNHNFYFLVARSHSIKEATEAIPEFHNGKVTVLRSFPEGDLVKYLMIGDKIYLIESELDPWNPPLCMEVSDLRRLRWLQRGLKMPAGIINMIRTLSDKGKKIKDEYHLKSFEPIIDWNNKIIPEELIIIYLKHIMFITKVVTRK